jgi:hypothetical protein
VHSHGDTQNRHIDGVTFNSQTRSNLGGKIKPAF